MVRVAVSPHTLDSIDAAVWEHLSEQHVVFAAE